MDATPGGVRALNPHWKGTMPSYNCVENTARPSSTDPAPESSQISRIVNKPGFLMVSITQTMLFVHRSLRLPVTDDWYGIVRDLVGDDEPILRQIVDDPGMMLGKAEHLLYALSQD